MNFRDSYCTIQGWMIEDLHLAGNELIVYATIYGFCRDGQNWYKLSQDYVAKWAGITTRGLRKILTSLKEKGLLRMRNDGTGGCSEYITLKPSILPAEGAELSSGGAEQSSGGCGTQFQGVRNSVPGGAELSSAPTSNNNIYNNNYNNMGNASENRAKKFVKPSIEQISDYCKERQNRIDPQKFFDYYESNGWKVGKNPMKDWKAAVRTWERNGYSGSATDKQQRQYGSNNPEGFDFFEF